MTQGLFCTIFLQLKLNKTVLLDTIFFGNNRIRGIRFLVYAVAPSHYILLYLRVYRASAILLGKLKRQVWLMLSGSLLGSICLDLDIYDVCELLRSLISSWLSHLELWFFEWKRSHYFHYEITNAESRPRDVEMTAHKMNIQIVEMVFEKEGRDSRPTDL